MFLNTEIFSQNMRFFSSQNMLYSDFEVSYMYDIDRHIREEEKFDDCILCNV